MRRTFFCGVLIILSRAAPTIGQTDEFANRLVVMIKAGSSQGAGIVCGADTRGIYIATADHVVRPGTTPARISVSFFHEPDREVSAELLPQRDATLDIAVLRVPVTPELQSLPFHQKADLSQLKRGSEVYLLGNPGGRAWRMSLRPEAIAQIRGDLLEFESNLITGGHSGGALLTAGKEIAGMLRSDNPPYGEAVSIDRILERLKGWGYRANLSLALPKLTMGVEINCHLQPSGQARCWEVGGKAQELEAVASLQLAEISAGHYHVCGIETGGKAFCWGRNTSGQLGNGTTMERHAVPVAVSGTHRFSSITAGATHTCALDQEHRAWCWGRGVEGRLGNDTGKDSSEPVEVAGGLRFQSLSAGSQHTCGVAENGDLYCWGGILGSGMSRAGVDAPDAFVPLLVKTNLKFRTVSAGGDLSCAVSVEADAYCWSSTEAANVRGLPRPTSLHIAAVPGRHKFTAISAGIDHACGVTTDSRVYCWGANDSGQLGSGSIEDTLIPVAAAVDVAFDSVAAGFQQTCAVSGTSTWCWGRNQSKDGRPTRFAALGGGPGELRPPTPPAASPAALAVGGKIPPMDWKGTLERPLFGFPDACQAADLEFSGQQNAFTLQLKCQTIVNETLSLALKSEGGARTITGQVNTRKLSQEKIDQWAAQLETEVLSLTEALAYPAFLAKPARALVHASGRIDRLEFDSSQRLRYVSATTSKEILFDQYKPVDGVSVPFEIRLNTKEEISVLKLREIRFR